MKTQTDYSNSLSRSRLAQLVKPFSKSCFFAMGMCLIFWHTSLFGNDQPAKKPDVLMIVIDDLNDWIDLLNGDSPIKTPNLRRLAQRGMLFTKAYCASPACNPSRVSALTGLRPTTTGVYGNKSDWKEAVGDRPTLMQCFKKAGYDVHGAGKIFHHHLNGAFHDDDSFHKFQHMSKQTYPAEKLNRAPSYGSKNTDWGAFPKNESDSIDYKTVSFCVEALKDNSSSKPLFLACGIFKPHSPFFAPRKYHTRYTSLKMPEREPSDWDDLPDGAHELLKNKKWFWNGMMKVEKRIPGSYQQFVQSYAACASFADAQVGRLLDALDKSPRSKNTVIVLWSDHGFHLGEKNHIEKFALWEKSTHIPLIIVAPGITNPGSLCDHPVDMTILHPTLLDLAGIKPKTKTDGTSIKSLLKNPTAEWKQPALTTYLPGNHAIRSQRYRYIRYSDGSEELYDHATDPLEWKNIANLKQHKKIVSQLKKWLPKTEVKQVPNLKR